MRKNFSLAWPDWSISTRLTLWYGGTMLALLVLFAVFCYSTFHAGLHRDFDRHLQIKQRELLAHVDTRRASGRLLSVLAGDLEAGTYQANGIYGTYVRLLSPTGEVVRRSPNFQAHAPLPVRLPELSAPRETSAREAPVRRLSRTWEGKPARTHYMPIYRGGQFEGWLELTGFEWSLHQGLHRLGWILALETALSLFLAVGGGYLLARRALRPVSKFTDAADEIGAANLEKRLPVPADPRDELTRLAETFNGMIGRLEASFKRERRFTANAAHELLTPLTTMRSEVEVALRRDRASADYRAVLDAVLTDTQAMANAVRSLLALSRADRLSEDGENNEHDLVNLDALAQQHVRHFRERADAKGVTLSFAGAPPAGPWVRADEEMLGKGIIYNLLDNALKYTPDGGRVEVAVTWQGETACLRVSDSGVGFEPERAEHLFGRFFRADTSEVQARPGSGLGLSVARAVARALGGDVTARSDGPGRGSTFEVCLPACAEQM